MRLAGDGAKASVFRRRERPGFGYRLMLEYLRQTFHGQVPG
jgi:hypothetical protein